jgi:hypothetical protein
MIRSVLLLGLLACAGCGAEAPPFVSAPSGATRAGGGWQQFCEQAWNVAQASAFVSARGAEGWELVAMYNGVLCYKRPALEGPREAHRPAAPSAPGNFVPLVRDPGF